MNRPLNWTEPNWMSELVDALRRIMCTASPLLHSFPVPKLKALTNGPSKSRTQAASLHIVPSNPSILLSTRIQNRQKEGVDLNGPTTQKFVWDAATFLIDSARWKYYIILYICKRKLLCHKLSWKRVLTGSPLEQPDRMWLCTRMSELVDALGRMLYFAPPYLHPFSPKSQVPRPNYQNAKHCFE